MSVIGPSVGIWEQPKFSLLPPDNATGNFVKVIQRVPVKIILKNSEALKDKLRPGMSVKVSVKVS